MNEVEQGTWNCMRGLMLHLDPDRKGWCIDAGVGHFDFYCEWMSLLGYRTIAIEPALAPNAVEMCQRRAIPLIEAALSDHDGVVVLHAARERDIYSIDPDVWGDMAEAQMVQAVTLQALIDRFQIEQITALKLDIEGAEPAVISALPGLAIELLPEIVSFEWGGEFPAKLERGPWHPKHRQRVEEAFQTLRALGYRRGLMIGSGDGIIMRLIDAHAHEFYFEPDDNWGNVILTRGDVPIDTIVEYAQTTVGEA